MVCKMNFGVPVAAVSAGYAVQGLMTGASLVATFAPAAVGAAVIGAFVLLVPETPPTDEGSSPESAEGHGSIVLEDPLETLAAFQNSVADGIRDLGTTGSLGDDLLADRAADASAGD